MPLTEQGHFVYNALTERGNAIFGDLTDQGYFIFSQTSAPSGGLSLVNTIHLLGQRKLSALITVKLNVN